ncbi:MAG: dihydrofolate reductase family protein [Candidatus Paceibacterota bacterium]
MDRSINTLFMLTSVDGKISTGDTNAMDVDKDFPKVVGVKEGLSQYYEIEKTTDFFSLNSGRVFAKIGFNEKTDEPEKIPVTFVIIDSKPHLNESGMKYVSKKGEKVIIVTTNENHPAYKLKEELDNVEVIKHESEIDFVDMFSKLKNDFGAERVTVQTGGTLNAELVRNGLIDYLSLVVAPVLVGGEDTPTLMDGESLHIQDELFKLKALELESVNKLQNSYLHLVYKVLN